MTVLWLAAQAGPAPAGTPSWCHGFCQRENKVITIITLHRTTSAKTRATATLRQRHIPPNVSSKLKIKSHLGTLFVRIPQNPKP